MGPIWCRLVVHSGAGEVVGVVVGARFGGVMQHFASIADLAVPVTKSRNLLLRYMLRD